MSSRRFFEAEKDQLKERFSEVAHVFIEAQAREAQAGPRFGARQPDDR